MNAEGRMEVKMWLLTSSLMACVMVFPQSALAQNSTERIGNWIYITNAGDNAHGARYVAESGDKAGNILAVMCDRKGLKTIYVKLMTQDKLADGDGVVMRPFKYRVDGGAVLEQYWQYEKNHAISIDYGGAMVLISNLINARNIQVRLMTHQLHAVDGLFDLDGSEQIIPRVIRDCSGP
ncbi:hypothetical protein [Azospirillum sp. sgz302134]